MPNPRRRVELSWLSRSISLLSRFIPQSRIHTVQGCPLRAVIEVRRWERRCEKQRLFGRQGGENNKGGWEGKWEGGGQLVLVQVTEIFRCFRQSGFAFCSTGIGAIRSVPRPGSLVGRGKLQSGRQCAPLVLLRGKGES
jgi:hypothetical protein